MLDRVVNEGAVVPALWRLEIANAFQSAIRRKRIDVTFRDNALAELAMMDIVVDPETDTHAWSTTVHLADRFRLTAYDASYLELAHRRRLPLATLDEALRRGGAALGVLLLGTTT